MVCCLPAVLIPVISCIGSYRSTGKNPRPRDGGNNPLIIENPEDTDAAVHLTIQSAFVTAGQRCTCARRLLVKKGAQGDAFLTRLVEVSQRLMPGNWDAEPQPFMGGLISEQAAQHVYDAWQRLASLGDVRCWRHVW